MPSGSILDGHVEEPTPELAHHGVRIAPLNDPIPLIPSQRPSPLEPATYLDGSLSASTVRLTSRSRAFTQPPAPLQPGSSTSRHERSSFGTASLPGLTSASYSSMTDLTDRNVPGQSSHILERPRATSHSAHHTGPTSPGASGSAAIRLPAIAPAPSVLPPSHMAAGASDESTAMMAPVHDFSSSMPGRGRRERQSRRTHLRTRRNWTAEETEDLLAGVNLYGVGKWKKILDHEGFRFHPERNQVDLKDRFRTCRMHEDRLLVRDRAHHSRLSNEADHQQKAGAPGTDGGSPQTLSRGQVADEQHERPSTNATASSEQSPKDPPTNPPAEASTSSSSTSRPTSGKKRSPCWTADEDTSLASGYYRYGFRWTAIARDPNLNLMHRTGAQVRDRFRQKYPTQYQLSLPMVLPEDSGESRTSRRSKKSRRAAAQSAPAPLPLPMGYPNQYNPHPPALPIAGPPHRLSLSSNGTTSRSSNSTARSSQELHGAIDMPPHGRWPTWARPNMDDGEGSDEVLSAGTRTSTDAPSSPNNVLVFSSPPSRGEPTSRDSMMSSSMLTSAAMGIGQDRQLPAPQTSASYRTRSSTGGRSPESFIGIMSSPPAGAAAAAAEADDTRALSIHGLLNDEPKPAALTDQPPSSRQLPSRNIFDGAAAPAGGTWPKQRSPSITLPPLLFHDMTI